jgi:hypothetical protein
MRERNSLRKVTDKALTGKRKPLGAAIQAMRSWESAPPGMTQWRWM